MGDRIFYSICFGFILGVLLRSFLSVNFYVVALAAVISFAVFLFFLLTSERRWGVIIPIFILTFSLGVLRFHAVDKPAPEFFEAEVGKKVVLAGQIVDEPSARETNQHLVFKAVSDKAKTKVLAYAGLEEYYRYGDEIKIEGRMEKPENFATDTGKEFDYINYLRKNGIFYVMLRPEIEIISRGHGNPVKEILFGIKNKFLEKINFAIPSPESLLMGGLILGERAAFPGNLRQDFIDTGTIHIVALSGYNVTIVAEWFMKFLRFLPQHLAYGAGIFSILIFVLMTGASSTAVRAGIMASLALLARAAGRDYDVARALVLAGVAMVLINPFILVYDVSFQLSFLATVAVIFFAPKVEKYFWWTTKKFGLRDILSVTTAAYVFVFPFILYKMGNFSAVALPANILVLPFVPLTMAFGFLTGLLGILWQGLAVPLGFISYILLRYELGVVKTFADFPFAALNIPYFPLILTILIYTVFAHQLFGRSIKNFFFEPKSHDR